MTAQDAQNHIEDIKSEISFLLFHRSTLERKIELLKPKIESGIVKPTKISNLSQITAKDIEKDLIPATLANMETVIDREQYYYAITELANTKVAIEAKTELLKSYTAHIKQELLKEGTQISDTMIFDAFHAVQKINDLLPEEASAMKDIDINLLKYVNSDNQKRMEVYETLKNIIKSHQS